MSRAAQYVRMSTEHQKYSTENQADAIRRYAEQRGITIVETFADDGKSGLNLQGRDALQRLIDVVTGGSADFDQILVYDISRWGRFQDTDESAHYEYLCRQAGIAVHYCAEQFENDGSLSATLLKSVKRVMAGEYSRDLSAKVFAGQCRLVSLGFRQGGMAGFGLRRQMVDEHRQPKIELAIGERKSLQTDRVVLVPGPDDEVETVRWMYRAFVAGRVEAEIAEVLNREGRLTNLGRPWTRGTVRQVLTSEKYVGNNVFNQVSFKLKQRRVVNAPEQWVRAVGAFPPVVEPSVFEAAQAIFRERGRRIPDGELLDRLKAVLAQSGSLSALVIDEQDGPISSSLYRTRFGSLLRAYRLIGYEPSRDYRYLEINRFLRELHPGIVEDAVAEIRKAGGSVERDPLTDLLTVNGEFTVSIVIVRCFSTPGGASRWKVRFDAGLRPDITVALRMAPGNGELLDCYLLPALDFGTFKLRLAEDNGLSLDAYRFVSIARLVTLAARTPIRIAV